MLDQTIALMSQVINVLKRVLVLTAMLFLVENLINFWILASMYVYLPFTMPQFVLDALSPLYNAYNEPFLNYLNLNVPYPSLSIGSNGSENFDFNVLSFLLESIMLVILTAIEVTIISKILKYVKQTWRKKRAEKIETIVNQREKEKKLKNKELNT